MMEKLNIAFRLIAAVLFLALFTGLQAQCGSYVEDGDEISCGDPNISCCQIEGACNGPGSACNNYDPDYAATGGCDLSCVVEGCLDPLALNFDESANNDANITCTYIPEDFAFTATAASGLFLSQITLNGVPAESDDWVAAFDAEGNCAGANQILLNEAAYAQLVIYGDDMTTPNVDEGMNGDESFTLVLFDASSELYYEYYDWVGESNLTGWVNTNGAPMPAFSDASVVFDFSTSPYSPLCDNPEACNYDEDSSTSTGCIYPDSGYDCSQNCLVDSDDDGVCDEFEIEGCLDNNACNFSSNPTDLVDCIYALSGYDCAGICLNDADDDGVCDEFEITGCTDAMACNFDDSATEDDSNCEYPPANLDCLGNCLNDTDGDGVCDESEVDGCTNDTACNYDSNSTDDDGSCAYPSPGYDCSGDCVLDVDNDGVCDVEDSCVGFFDACGICNGPGAIYDCGCASIPTGDCDCDGNQIDVLGECGGDCLSDADDDGVCDDDEIFGCTLMDACNFNSLATENDESCTDPLPGFDCNGNCLLDADGDGVCDEDEILGCNQAEALNFNPSATEDNGSCLFPADPPTSFDYTVTPSSGTIIAQVTVDGLAATGFDWIAAFDENGNCAAASMIIVNEGEAYINLTIYGDDATTIDLDEGMSSDEDFALVLWDESALTTINYSLNGADVFISGWSNTNGAPIPGLSDSDEVYEFSSANADPNCDDSQACNFDAEATSNLGCNYADWGYDCAGNCLADLDGDGICNPFEEPGCTNELSCNFSASATDEDGTCYYADFGYDCNGNCLADTDGDGICDALELPGCLEQSACNYNPLATDDSGTCVYPNPEYNCEGECINDVDFDGVCDEFEIIGCTDPLACNYNSTATDDNGNCIVPSTYFNCEGQCVNDFNSNSVCDELEGCTDLNACNYEAENVLDDGSCAYPDLGYNCSGVCLSDSDADGICDLLEIPGCTYVEACNYSAIATDDDGTCFFVPAGLDCSLNCLYDADDDGVCDENELSGCTNEEALNYTALATDDDGSCVFETCPSDLDGDGSVSIGDVLELLTDYGMNCNENE